MNKVAFYYRKDLNVTKHGEYKAAADMMMGDAGKRNEITGLVELAANSSEFEGIIDAVRWNVQGSDSLEIKKGERCRIGVGVDYEFVVKGNHNFSGLDEGAEIAVENGKFVAPTEGNDAVGKIIKKFKSDEVVVRIY